MLKRPEILYPSYLDTAFEVTIKNEADIPYPYVYRVIVHDIKTGKRINPSDEKDYWAQYPDPIDDEDLLIDTSRVLLAGQDITFRINVALILLRNDNKYGKYLVSFYTSNQEENYSLAEDVQRIIFKIHKPGKKPVNVH